MASQKLFVGRLIWASLILGQILFAVVVVLIRGNMKPAMAADQTMLLHVVDAVVLAALGGIGFMVWRAIARPGDDGLVDPGKWLTGLIIFLGGCEAASLFGIILVLLSGQLHPGIVVPIVALAVQLIAFPRPDNLRSA
jgi:hypothetical protein